MKKRNKILPALLFVLTILLFTACSGASEEIKEPTDVSVGSESVSKDSGSADSTQKETDETSGTEVTVAETVLYDSNGVVVTATGCEEGWMGPEISVLIENNTQDTVLITADELSVNGYMMPFASLYAEIAPEKKANESISLSQSELKQAGIDTIAQLQFYIQVQDADTWDTLDTSALITLDTSAAGYVQPIDSSGDILYDANGIKIVCKGLKQDMIWDGTVVFFMENNSGKPITVYAEEVSVNGFMQDVGLWSDLRDGTVIIDGMSLLDLSDLELESIDEVEDIEFSLRIINSDNWDTIASTDPISLTF